MIDLSHDDKLDEVFSVDMDAHVPQQQDVLQNLRDQVAAEEAQLKQLKNIVRLKEIAVEKKQLRERLEQLEQDPILRL